MVLIVPVSVSAKSGDLLVPAAYPTIQAAIDAAQAGSTIRIGPGTYVEQLSIGKDLTLVGSGALKTIIRAPGVLANGVDGHTSIVEIHDGAAVRMSQLAISGPGAGHCGDGELRAGISVIQGSQLDLSDSRVAHIRNTPLDNCFRSGVGVLAPDFSPVRVNVERSEITDFGTSGIVVAGFGSTSTLRFNLVKGQGRSTVVATSGIELIFATGTISHNVVSGNACGSADLGCGPDWFSEVQATGISAGGEGVVIANNLLAGNQVGIYANEAAAIHDNVLWNNDYFGIALQDGSFTVDGDNIRGGEGGVAVIAGFANAVADLHGVRISHTAGQHIQTFEQNGFTATYNEQH
jgi:hypothetical protein